jgi:hypothetical protein
MDDWPGSSDDIFAPSSTILLTFTSKEIERYVADYVEIQIGIFFLRLRLQVGSSARETRGSSERSSY